MKSGAPRDELKNGRGRGWAVPQMSSSPKVLNLNGCFSSENPTIFMVTLFFGQVLSERALRLLLINIALHVHVCHAEDYIEGKGLELCPGESR